MRPPVILEFPGRGDSYSDSFCAALNAAGACVVEGRYSIRWLLKHLRRADFVHFHWPSFHYGDRSALAAFAKSLLFAFMLIGIRLARVRLLWTAHNLYPHERSSPPWVDSAVRKLVVALSDRVFVHGKTAGAIVQRELGVDARRLVPIVHGSFLDYYPMHASREEARRRLGLPLDARVLAFVGHCRRYKNVTGLVTAFQQHVDDAWLVIAGNCPEPAYRAELEALIRAKPQRILRELRYIVDADLQYFIRAADAVVLPFRDVLTSGSAILALSFGRPVVGPRLGNMVEVVNEEVGILYDPDDPGGLASGMRAALGRRFDQGTIMRYAASLRWQDTAVTVLESLREAG